MADDIIESRVREWLRDHQGSAYCARCVARDLHIDVALAQAAMDDLSTRQVFSRGLCACGAMALAYGWSAGGMRDKTRQGGHKRATHPPPAREICQ